MIKNTELIKIADAIRLSQNIVITTHANPDGDAIGSSFALKNHLKNIGINAEILLFNNPSKNLIHLLDSDYFIYERDNDSANLFNESDLIIVLDFNDPRRVKDLETSLVKSPSKKIVIDHHQNPKEFADFYFVDTNIGSTGELVWQLIRVLSGEIDIKVAEAIYVAIMTDHGNFKYERTTSKTFQIASELCEIGVEPHKIYDNIFNNNSLNSVKLFAKVSAEIDTFLDDKIAILTVREEDFAESGALEEDTEGFASVPLTIAGVEVGVLMIESQARNEIRCSFRSKGKYHIRNVAEIFGGGGHDYAAGARIKNKNFDIARREVIDETLKYVKSRI